MPGDEVTVAQLCGKCSRQISTFTVKKDNLFLSTKEQIWCPHCDENTPEVRDVSGRLDSIQREQESYPELRPASLPQKPSNDPDV